MAKICLVVLCGLIAVTLVAAGSDHDNELLWGTYRSNLYWGARTRSEHSLMTGLMWYHPRDPNYMRGLRHECRHEDRLTKYGWLRHDGRYFGEQEIVDKEHGVRLTTHFVKRARGTKGGDWVLRVSGNSTKSGGGGQISLLMYAYLEDEGDIKLHHATHKGLRSDVLITGSTPTIGDFSLHIPENTNNTHPENMGGRQHADLDRTHFLVYKEADADERWKVKQAVESTMWQQLSKAMGKKKEKKSPGIQALPNTNSKSPTTVIIQKFFNLPFEVDMLYLSHEALPSTSQDSLQTEVQSFIGPSLSSEIQRHTVEFDSRFEKTFALEAKGYKQGQIKFAKAAFSNMIGGMGYFRGTAVHSRKEGEKYRTKPLSLYTAVPSRSFFPRGFLWDEGFHQLLIGEWDESISQDAISHWANLVDKDGWVAREQILGPEAESRVPPEFITQHSSHANPPTLLLPLRRLLEKRNAFSDDGARANVTEGDRVFFQRVLPSFQRQYRWLMASQRGPVKNSFRWRGRTADHTLTSGLDDYPRSVRPSDAERHVDLFSWMTFSTQLMGSINEVLEKGSGKDLLSSYESLKSELHHLHYNRENSLFCDYTGHDETLVFPPKDPENPKEHSIRESKWVGHEGYITLFPLLTGLLSADDPGLGATLDLMFDSSRLWSPFGLRSLSAKDRLFGVGEDYWRGKIWININYLALSALHRFYIHTKGPYQAKAEKVYTQLRRNVISNVFAQYKKTGYIWENFSPHDGSGKGCHPFTGWSSLVVLMMAEIY